MAIRVDMHGDFRPAHLGRAVGDVAQPIEVAFDIFVRVGADEIPHLGAGRHHVRLGAAVGDDVMNAAGFLDVFAHVVRADVHQLNAVEGATALLGTAGGVRGQTGERKLGGDQRLGGHVGDAVFRAGVPVQAGVEVGELVIERHIHLADNGLLGRRPVQADGALDMVLVDSILDGEGRADGGGAEAQWPQPWPALRPGIALRVASAACCDNSGSASYSARMPMIGLPEPYSATNAVGMSLTPSLTRKPAFFSTPASRAAERCSCKPNSA